MAPVAPHCADIEQDRFVVPLCVRKCFLAPLMPLDRLMHGRAKIRGGSVQKGVLGLFCHCRFSVNGLDHRGGTQTYKLRG